MKMWLSPYQKLRAYLEGKRIYKARKSSSLLIKPRYFYASSLEQAQSKFLHWNVSRSKKIEIAFVPNIKFYWKCVWMNCITWEEGYRKAYRWGYWNYTVRGIK